MKSNTKIIKKRWESVACNSCESKQYLVVWKDVTSWEHPGKFRIVECMDCGLRYLNPRPVPRRIGKYYPKQSYWGEDVTKKSTLESDHERERSYGYLYSMIPGKNGIQSVFDVGAGTGLFLSKFRELGWKVGGNELSQAAVRYARKEFKINLDCGDFLRIKPHKGKYDVITLNNSLEHLYDPLGTLKSIKKMLKPGGKLFITVPNMNGLGVSIFGKDWYAIQPPRHLYHFSEQTLSNLLSEAGFTVNKTHYWYWLHNYSAIFESFRIRKSPRFQTKSRGNNANPQHDTHFSIKKEMGKIIFKIISAIIAMIGSLLHRSETITVVASTDVFPKETARMSQNFNKLFQLLILSLAISIPIVICFRKIRGLFPLPAAGQQGLMGYAQYFGYPLYFENALLFSLLLIPIIVAIVLRRIEMKHE